MEATIYALCDPDSHEVRYIGKTQTSMHKRMLQHVNDKSATYRGKWLRGLKCRGVAPVAHVLELTTDWVEAEQFWIAYFKGLGARLANATIGGEGACGYSPNEATRQKLSLAHKGRKCSEETRKKISEKAKGNKRSLGIKRSDEFKAAVSKRCKGIPLSPETIEKLSIIRKGKPWSEKQWANYKESRGGTLEENSKKVNSLFAKGYLQREIAEKLKLPPYYVSKLIAAHPDKEEIKRQYFANRSKRPEIYALFHSESQIAKTAAALRGRKLSEETRKKMSESQRLRHLKKRR